MVNQCGCVSTFQDAGILRQIDLTLVPKIGTYVKECVTETREMKQLLKDIIKPETLNGAYIPDPNNKPFFTRTSAICSHITMLNGNLVTLWLIKMFAGENQTMEIVK